MGKYVCYSHPWGGWHTTVKDGKRVKRGEVRCCTCNQLLGALCPESKHPWSDLCDECYEYTFVPLEGVVVDTKWNVGRAG